MPEQLQPNGNPVRVGNITLRTPGMAGIATALPPAPPGSRSLAPTASVLDRALQAQGVRTMNTIEIARPRPMPLPMGMARSGTNDRVIEVDVPDPGESFGQAVLYTDEKGFTRWSFARETRGTGTVTRGQATRTYVIGQPMPAAGAPDDMRGITGAIAKKVLKVVVFPLIDPILGEIGDFFASRWEKANRPYRVRNFTSGNFALKQADTFGAAEWQKVAQGPSLLFVHGTNSLTHTGFGTLPAQYVAELNQRYGGRVFALDHPTISEDPKQNVEWLITNMPDGQSLDLDIICHSRGGLVSRVLAERQAEFALANRNIKVRKIVFVATPNAGTTLADVEHLGELLDSYTNLLSFFPDNGVTDTLEAVLTVVKQVAVGALKGLEGLGSMRPKGPFLTDLNKGPKVGTRYYALAANYEPRTDSGIAFFARDLITDRLFRNENDLIVPTGGVWDANGSACFPIEDRQVFAGTDAVHHSGFFGDATARQKMLDWLRE